MDDNNIIDVTEATKKQPWYKRAWNKIKSGFGKFVDWLDEWWDDVIFPIVMFLYGITLGLLWGKIFGLIDKDNNQAHFDAGERQGRSEGYLEAIKDVENSGFKVYGGYGEHAGDMIVTKIEETDVKPE